MKRILLLLAATSLGASPTLAQHAGHNMPGMTMPMPAKKPPSTKRSSKKPVKKAIAKRVPAKKTAAKKAPTKKPAAKKPAAGHQHDMSQMPGTEMLPAQGAQGQTPAGHDMPTMPGHDMSKMPGVQMPADQHAGHNVALIGAGDPPLRPPPPTALQGPENAADTVYGAAAMQPSRAFLLTREHGGMKAAKLLIDQLESRTDKGEDGYYLNAQGWFGGDIDKLWLKSEVEGNYGRKADRAEFQALWSHAIDPWFDLQAGVRFDAAPKDRARLAVGVQGLAPYWIETEATAFVSSKGDVTVRLDLEHDMRITRKLILQPRAELNFSLQDIPGERLGAGLSTAELGLRLRYEFVPNFAPYIGVAYSQGFGATKRFVRADREDPSRLQFVVGLRTWF